MHFFSRKKTLFTASLAALGGLTACGDDVVVPVIEPPVVIVITPANASMNIGESLSFAVQVTGGSTTTPPSLQTCASSNSSVATATKDGSSCKVTAVATGNVTVTATASTGQVASSAVAVSAQTAAISGLTVSPAQVSLAPSQSVRVTPNVTRGNGVTTVFTYTSSNSAIATFDSVSATTGTGRIIAVAPGVATITVTAAGTGTGFTATTLSTAITVNVGSTPSGITTFTVVPGSLNLAVGRTAGLTATQTQPAGAPVGIITYSSSNTAVATVNATTGLVTAIAPGTANITAKDSSAASANGQFATTVLTQIISVTVQALANVSIQAINQGPYVTTGLDSAYAVVGSQTPGPGNIPIGPATGVIAGIRRTLNPQIDQPIDVTNTKDQIQVILNLQPNGQRVDSVVVYIDSGATNTTARRAAGRQIYSNGDAGTGATVSITTFILTEDFTPNDVTGNGDVAYVNGLKRISASVWTTLSTGQTCVSGGPAATNNTTPCELQNASAIRQNVNFNNIDGFALKMTRPANSATDVSSRTWWGGPTVSDIGQPSGLGSFQTYPVIFTPNRTIQHVSATFGNCLGFGAGGIPNFVTDSAGPWLFTFGNGAPATPPASSKHIACTTVGAYDQADQFRFEDYPMVVASLDNSNNPGPRVLYAYNPTTGTDPYAGPRTGVLGLYRYSPQLTAPDAIRIDYQAPVLTLAVTQSNGERWVNDAYLFNTNYSATDITIGAAGVGLFPTVAAAGTPELRNTIFRVASANPACGPQTFQDVNTIGQRRTASIAQVFSIAPNTNRESPCDFTNNAFVAQATETDKLGNRGIIGNTQFSTTTGGVTTVTPASPLFGIDNTLPELVIPGGTNTATDMPNLYSATGDSIFQPVNGATAATPIATTGLATDFWFGARYTDTRAGFNITNHGTRTVKRFAPNATPLLSNRAVVTTVASRTMNFVGGQGNPVDLNDPIYRRDSLTIYGAGSIATTTGANPTVPQTANPAVGYYQYNITVTDRAGNSNSLQERAVIDQTSPIVTGTTIPAVFGATGSAVAVAQTFFPTGTDDVEAVDWDLMLRYNALSLVGDSSSGSTVITDGARMRFRRDRFANLHNAWAVFSDTLLATPFGPAAVLSGTGMTSPIASIRGIEPVDSTDAPIAYGAVTSTGSGTNVVNPFTNFKPNKVGVYAFDVRATHVSKGAPYGWPAPYASNLPFVSLGMTNLFPTLAPSGGEAGYTENLFVGNISNGSSWDGKDLNPATAGLDRLVSWSGFGGTGSNIEFRAVTSTIVTQPPFPTVHLFKWEVDAQHTGTGLGVNETTLNDSASGNWVYVGSLNSAAPSNPVINDQGATRFWRYGFSSAAYPSVTNGMIVQPGVTTGCYRAVGVDASGDGITTKSFGSGCPVPGAFANQTQVVSNATNMTVTLRAYGNGAGNIITTSPGATFQLLKGAANGVDRVSQNRPNVGLTVTIGAASGYTLDRAPTGCTTLTPAVYPLAGPATVTCTYTVFAPGTITAIFEAAGAGGP